MCVSIDGEEDKAKRSKGKGRYDKIGGGSKIYLEIGSSPATAPSVGEECSLAGWLDQPRTAASSDPWGGSERMEGRAEGRKEGTRSDRRPGEALQGILRSGTARSLLQPASQLACRPNDGRTDTAAHNSPPSARRWARDALDLSVPRGSVGPADTKSS